MLLRDYQACAVEAVRTHARGGRKAILIVAPTGAGKTRIGCEFIVGAAKKGNSVLFVCHRAELIRQTADALRVLGVPCGIIAPWAPDTTHPNLFDKTLVQVASIQTLLARGQLPDASLVILDEAHHYVSAEWGTIAKKLSHAFVLGLTATPQRGDGAPLGDLFDTLVPVAQPQELIDAGYLVPMDVVAPPRAQTGAVSDPIEAFFDNPQTHKNGKPKQTIVFAANRTHAHELAKRFCERGVRASCIDEEMRWDRRADTIAQFAAGELDLLTNVYCLTEGLDVPGIEVVILARGCGSQGMYIQMVGRAMRPAPGKQRALLIDCKGCVYQHGLPSEDREYSLTGTSIKVKRKKKSLRTCIECGAVSLPHRRTCERCNAEFSLPKAPTEHKTKLKTVTKRASWSEKFDILRALKRIANERGYKPGWCWYRFKDQFGHPPSSAMWRSVT